MEVRKLVSQLVTTVGKKAPEKKQKAKEGSGH